MQVYNVCVSVPQRGVVIEVYDAETMGDVKDIACFHLGVKPAECTFDEATAVLHLKQTRHTNCATKRDKKSNAKKRKHGQCKRKLPE